MGKKFKKTLLTLLASTMIIGAFTLSTGAEENNDRKVTIISGDNPSTIISQSVKVTAPAKVISESSEAITVKGNKGTVTYESSDKSVATVNKKGVIYGKTPGKTTITIRAAATTGYKEYTKKVTVIVIPKRIPSFKLTNENNGIKLKWTAVDNASGYVVYKRNAKGEYVKYANVKGTVYTDEAEAKSYGKTFAYKVFPYTKVKGTNIYGYSAARQIKRENLATVSLYNTANGINIVWTSVPNATGYRIYRKATTDKHYTKVKTVNKKTLNYIDTTGVSNYKTYIYVVRAVVNGKLAGVSNVKAITKIPNLSKVTVTKGAVGADTTKVKLSWTPLTKKASDTLTYKIYKSTNGGAYKLLATLKGTVGSYLDKTAASNALVSYKVYVSYKGNNSAACKVSAVNIVKPVIRHVVSNETNNLTIRWNPVKGVDGYVVYNGSKKVATVNANTEKYTIGNLKKDSVYTLSVQTYKKIGNKYYFSDKVSYKAAVKRIIPSNWKKVTYTEPYEDGETMDAYSNGTWIVKFVDEIDSFLYDEYVEEGMFHKNELILMQYLGNDKKVNMPGSINDIKVIGDRGSFAFNKTVEECYISPGITSLLGTFNDCDNLKKIVIPENSILNKNTDGIRRYIGSHFNVYTTRTIAMAAAWCNPDLEYYDIKTGKNMNIHLR